MDGTATTPNPSATMTCAHPVTVQITLDSTSISQASSLYLKTHGLNYSTQGSFQINGSPWVRMKNYNTAQAASQDNPNITILGSANRYGGIGGAFTIIRFLVPLTTPTSGAKSSLGAYLQSGTNSITFCFNGTDARSIGYRVVDINLYNSANAAVPLASGSPAIVTYEDNTDWTTVPADGNPANGAKIWSSANLVESSVATNAPILAHCSDCHTDSGSDLRYFNYSNFTIRQRAIFHGITNEQDLDDLAAYIRTLNVADTTSPANPGPGRPWWPVFQPGPGIDSKPGSYWAAGAGDTAVLDDDSLAASYYPNSPSQIEDAETKHVQALNVRQIPVAYQLLDWNHWLTPLHPADALGSVAKFQAEAAYTDFQTILTRLQDVSTDPSALAQYLLGRTAYNPAVGQVEINWTLAHGDALQWYEDRLSMQGDIAVAVQAASGAMTAFAATYDAALWGGVKMWQYHQQYGLESIARPVIGLQAEQYEWYDNDRFIFDISPHLTGCCNVNDQFVPLIGDIAAQNALLAQNPMAPQVQLNSTYLNEVWYETQMILHHGTNTYDAGGHYVIDWGYMRGQMANAFTGLGNYMEPLRAMKYALINLYEHDTGVPPSTNLNAFGDTFDPFQHNSSYSSMLLYGFNSGFTNSFNSHPEYMPLVETYYQVWLEKMGAFNLEDWPSWSTSFADDGITVPLYNSTLNTLQIDDGYFPTEINMLQKTYSPCASGSCTGLKMASAIVNAYARWTSEVWPGSSSSPTNWSSFFMAPGNLAAPTISVTSGVGSNQIQWNNVSGATSYNIKRATSQGQPGLTIAFFVSGNSYLDNQVVAGKTYYYSVSANEDVPGVAAHFGSQEGPDSAAVAGIPTTGLIASWAFDSYNSSPSTTIPNSVSQRPLSGYPIQMLQSSSSLSSPYYMNTKTNLAFWLTQSMTLHGALDCTLFEAPRC